MSSIWVNLILILGYLLVLILCISNMVIALSIFRIRTHSISKEAIKSYWEVDDHIKLFAFGMGYLEQDFTDLFITHSFIKMVRAGAIFIALYLLLLLFTTTEIKKTLAVGNDIDALIRVFLLCITVLFLVWSYLKGLNIYKFIREKDGL